MAEIDLGLHIQTVDRLRAPGERLQGGLQTEVVERRRAQLGDQVAQAVDLVAQAPRAPRPRPRSAPACRRRRGRWPAAGAARRCPGCSRRGSPAPSACARARAPPCHSAGASISTERSAASRCATLAANALRASRSGPRKPPSLRRAITRPPPWPSMSSGSTSAARASIPSSCSQRGVLPARAVQRHRLAREVDRPQGASLYGHDPNARRAVAARGGHTQLATLLDHHQQRAGVEQRQARGRPSAAAATTLIPRASGRDYGPIASRPCSWCRGGPCLRQQLLAADVLSPGREPDRHAQRLALPIGFDLDRT